MLFSRCEEGEYMLKVKLITTDNNQSIDNNINEFLFELNQKSKQSRFAPHYNLKKISSAFNENGIFNQAIIEYEIKE